MQSIKNWSIQDRPTEKLCQKGAQHLTDSKLLSILINSGTTGKNAVDVAKELLAAADNDIKKLARLSVKEIVNLNIKGIGPAKAITITAALEMGIRREMSMSRKEVVLSSRDIADFLKAQIQYHKREMFVVVYLNKANKVNHYEIVSEGGMAGTGSRSTHNLKESPGTGSCKRRIMAQPS